MIAEVGYEEQVSLSGMGCKNVNNLALAGAIVAVSETL